MRRKTYILFFVFLLFYPGNGEQTLQLEKKKQILSPVTETVIINSYPRDSRKFRAPQLTATSAAILDLDSGVFMYGKNSNQRIKPASTLKMVTALTALDYYSLKQVLTAKTLDTEGAQMGLKIGEKVTVENLLYGLLLNSGSDAAFAFADNYNGGIVKFLYAMNKRLIDMNIKNTHFTNIIGYDEDNNYTTSRDLAQIGRFVLKNNLLKKIINTKETVVTNENSTRWYSLKNVNELLWKNLGVYGIKTGWTEEAGECLVSYIERGDKKLIIVVMGSKDRFGETEKLINWVFKNFEWLSFY